MSNLNKDRDQIILEHILQEDELNHANSHLGPVDKFNLIKESYIKRQWDDTEKYRVAFVMAPAWGVLFPPYNLAKLTGLIRHYGYSTKVYDLNIDSYQILKSTIDEDYWRGEKYFLWTIKENFEKEILPYVKTIFDNAIDEIVEANPKVIGFSTYNTNTHAVAYIITELKKRLPDSCFIAGGPEVATGATLAELPFNYLFKGEAEETFLSFLENLPEQYAVNEYIGSTDSKLKLENFPFSDYSDYNLANYDHPDGVSIETSRGCVAQCSFCAETYFWKFRSNTPERVVEEMEYQIKNYGVRRFWFVDSLVNGNLKVFEKIIDLIIEKKLNIKWNSYARCDGRMDKEFIRKIYASGCTCISYGVESGSQKVLNDMRKKVEVWEVENNLKHGREVGLFNHVNWILGFPTEEPIDFLHSLQLIANSRKHINAISPGFGAGPATASHMATDWKVYNMEGEKYLWEKQFLKSWYTTDYKNTILHRFMRIKLFHIWLEVLKDYAGSKIDNGQRYSNIKDFYSFNKPKKWFFNREISEYCEYDNFVKLNRIDTNMGIANEYLSLAYAMYQYFGGFELTVLFDPTQDLSTFGDWLVNDYTGTFKISVKDNGVYNMSLIHTFNHTTNAENKSFNETINETGNINSWRSKTLQIKETVHEQYRNKKKIITILPAV